MTPPTQARGPRTLDDVQGWLYPLDQFLIEWFLDRQNHIEPTGDLLELGVFHGKSAIVIGRYRREGETLTVCDLFEDVISDASVKPGMSAAYKSLTQDTFERNYLAFHPELPVIVKGRTDTILGHVEPGSCRFVHVDASHLYDHVRDDLQAARTVLRPGGVVVCDDFRAAHTPGTAAAIWEAVANHGLRVVAISANKLYGTWGDAEPLRDELAAHVKGMDEYRCHTQQVMGERLLRIAPPFAKAETPTGWRRAARQILPPVVTNAVRRRRASGAR